MTTDNDLNRILIRLAILVVIVIAIIFELAWFLQPRNYSSPKSPEAIQAIHVYQANPTAENEARLYEELHRNSSRNASRYALHDGLILGLMLIADITGMYFFWSFRATKSTV